MQDPKPNQYYKLSLLQAKEDYQDGILTATGLIYYAIGIYRKPGTKLKVANIAEFCNFLGVTISTFYRAIAKLQAKGRVGWEAIEGLNVWLQCNPNVIDLNSYGSDSQPCENDSQSCEKNSQPCEKNSQPCENDSQPCENDSQSCEKNSQPCDYSFLRDTPDKDSSDRENQLLDPSYSYQLFLQSLSQIERENFFKFLDRKVAMLPSKPVLLQKWAAKNLAELEPEFRSTEGNRRAIAMPSVEEMVKIQQLKDTGKIKGFELQPYNNSQTIVVDTGSQVLVWWEFLEKNE